MKHKLKKLLVSSVLLFAGISWLSAQQMEVIGKIVDNENNEAIGATIVVKGTANGVISNYDGNYKITVPDAKNTILVFSYVGMKTQEVKVAGQNVINVQFEPNVITLNEVVSIGYGTMRRRDLTGSISSVRTEEINKVPVTNVAQALAGKVAGVNIVQSDGSQDATMSIRVRGGLSITQDNEPLYIIDGFPSEDGMKGLDPSDIETIDVLKDASSTAIYGARGGNGVVLITTKSGKEGKATINYDAYFGFKKLTNKMALLNVEDFVRLEYERAMIGGANEKIKFAQIYGDGWDAALSDQDNMYAVHGIISDVYGNRPGIDWQGLIFDDAKPTSQNHKLSLTGEPGKPDIQLHIHTVTTKELCFKVDLSVIIYVFA